MSRSIGAVARCMADQESAQTKGKISGCFITRGGGGFSAKFRLGGCRPQFQNVTVG